MPLYKLFTEIVPYTSGFQKIIALDLGQKTIGIAISDQMKMIATGVETYKRQNFIQDVKYILDIADKAAAKVIILGWPLNMSGEAGERAKWVEGFAKKLLEFDNEKQILLWDERLSTFAVERTMLDADMSRKRRSQVVDKLAATFILQGFLDALPS